MANLLFAQKAVNLEDFNWVELGIVVVSLIAVGLAAGGVILWARRWASRPAEEASANDMLSDFKRLKAEGELTEEEFRRIRSVLDNKIRVQAGMAPVATEKFEPLPDEPAEEGEFEWREVDLKAIGAEPPNGGCTLSQREREWNPPHPSPLARAEGMQPPSPQSSPSERNGRNVNE